MHIRRTTQLSDWARITMSDKLQTDSRTAKARAGSLQRPKQVNVVLKRKADGCYIQGLTELPGYRHVTVTRHQRDALRMDAATAKRLYGFDFLGIPYHPQGYNPTIREPEFELVSVLDLSPNDKLSDHWPTMTMGEG